MIRQGIETQIGFVERKLAGKSVGNGDGENAGAFRGENSVGGIFENESAVGIRVKRFESGEKEIGLRFEAFDVFAGAESVEMVQQFQSLEVSGDPLAGRTGG